MAQSIYRKVRGLPASKKIFVDMNDVRFIDFLEIPYGYTEGLDGCFSINVIAETAAVIAHFSPPSMTQKMAQMENEIIQHNKKLQGAKTTVTFFPTPEQELSLVPAIQHCAEIIKSVLHSLGLTQIDISYKIGRNVEGKSIPSHWGTVVLDGTRKGEQDLYLEDVLVLTIRKGQLHQHLVTSTHSAQSDAATRHASSTDRLRDTGIYSRPLFPRDNTQHTNQNIQATSRTDRHGTASSQLGSKQPPNASASSSAIPETVVVKVRVVCHNIDDIDSGARLNQNHWSIYLLDTEGGSIRLNLLPGITDDKGTLEITRHAYEMSNAVRWFDYEVPSRIRARSFLNVVGNKKRNKYKMTRSGGGCRFWLLTIIDDWVKSGLITTKGAAENLAIAIQFKYLSADSRVKVEIEKGEWY